MRTGLVEAMHHQRWQWKRIHVYRRKLWLGHILQISLYQFFRKIHVHILVRVVIVIIFQLQIHLRLQIIRPGIKQDFNMMELKPIDDILVTKMPRHKHSKPPIHYEYMLILW